LGGPAGKKIIGVEGGNVCVITCCREWRVEKDKGPLGPLDVLASMLIGSNGSMVRLFGLHLDQQCRFSLQPMHCWFFGRPEVFRMAAFLMDMSATWSTLLAVTR
jgi:hypothetical protein